MRALPQAKAVFPNVTDHLETAGIMADDDRRDCDFRRRTLRLSRPRLMSVPAVSRDAQADRRAGTSRSMGAEGSQAGEEVADDTLGVMPLVGRFDAKVGRSASY